MFGLWNETDGVFAAPESFKTRRAARAFERRFRQRYEAQGYYLTAGCQRIAVEDIRLEIVAMEDAATP